MKKTIITVTIIGAILLVGAIGMKMAYNVFNNVAAIQQAMYESHVQSVEEMRDRALETIDAQMNNPVFEQFAQEAAEEETVANQNANF